MPEELVSCPPQTGGMGVDKGGSGVEDGNLGIMVPGVGGCGIEAVDKKMISCYMKVLLEDSRSKILM